MIYDFSYETSYLIAILRSKILLSNAGFVIYGSQNSI